jgi:pyrroloquinoline-quinone synthase
MSDVVRAIDALIDERSLLKHSFYTRWVEGTLPIQALQVYARQYYRFEAAFPRVLSSIHTQLDELADRQVVLENLVDEERGDGSHVELWLRFAEALGVSRDDVLGAEQLPETLRLVDIYRELGSSSAGEGLAALFAYERQVPAVAAAKLDGLARHYGLGEDDGVEFWKVHGWLDAEHADAEARLLAKHGGASAVEAAGRALDAWWDFLSEVEAAAA